MESVPIVPRLHPYWHRIFKVSDHYFSEAPLTDVLHVMMLDMMRSHYSHASIDWVMLFERLRLFIVVTKTHLFPMTIFVKWKNMNIYLRT